MNKCSRMTSKISAPLCRSLGSFKKGDKVFFFNPEKSKATVVDCYSEYNKFFACSGINLVKLKLESGRKIVVPLGSPKIILTSDLEKLQSDNSLVEKWLKYSYLYSWGGEAREDYRVLREQLLAQ
ncbi:hypothetical protein FWH09_03410 [Candidatus Saccharibacteria bacterium]|nr:hypothetical protein [Candidatus Saccharibacteria bacterium]